MKKLTKALCLSAALLATTAANAGWQYSGLVGLSGSHVWGDADFDYAAFTPSTGASAALSVDTDNDRWAWGILGGFQAKCNRLLLGLEVNVDWQNDHDLNRNVLVTNLGAPFTNLAVEYDNDAVVGITGRLGYDLSSWLMAYARAGVETYDRDLSFASATTPNIGNFVSAASGSRRTWAFVGGLGAELPVPIMAGLSFRAEWNYHSRGKSVDVTALSSNNLTFETVTVRPESANSVKASLVYNFPV